MQKRTIIITEILTILILSVFIGTVGGGSLFFGNINPIDEGQFGAWANHMLLGKYMYKDIYITYGPLFVYPLYVLFKIFGPSFFLVRAYILAGSIAGILLSLLIMYRLRIHHFVRYCVLLLLILLPAMQLRQAVGLLCIFSLMQATDKKSPGWWLITGISTVLSFLVSPDIGLFIFTIEVLICIWYLVSTNDSKSIFIKLTAYWFLGVIGTLIPFIFWSTSEGWLGAYTDVTKDLLFTFSGINLPNGMGFPNILKAIASSSNIFSAIKSVFSKEALLYWGILFYIVTVLYTIIIFLRDGTLSYIKNMILLLLFGFFLYSILIGRWGIGHFFFIIAPVVILFSYFATQLLHVNKKRKKSKIVAFVLLISCVLFAVRLLLINRPQITANLLALPSLFSISMNPARVGPIKISAEQKTHYTYIDEFVRRHVAKNQSIFFLSNEPGLYMFTNKVNPTRFDLPYIVITKAKRYELLADFQKRPPDFIINNTKEWDVDGISNRQRMPEVSSFIDKNYKEYKKNNGIVVYKYKFS